VEDHLSCLLRPHIYFVHACIQIVYLEISGYEKHRVRSRSKMGHPAGKWTGAERSGSGRIRYVKKASRKFGARAKAILLKGFNV
jgi:hypothetical protein